MERLHCCGSDIIHDGCWCFTTHCGICCKAAPVLGCFHLWLTTAQTAILMCNCHQWLMQDCGISSALAMEIPQSYTKPSIDVYDAPIFQPVPVGPHWWSSRQAPACSGAGPEHLLAGVSPPPWTSEKRWQSGTEPVSENVYKLPYEKSPLMMHCNRACHPGSPCKSYYPGALSLSHTSLQLIWRLSTRRFHLRCLIIKWVTETWTHDRVPG